MLCGDGEDVIRFPVAAASKGEGADPTADEDHELLENVLHGYADTVALSLLRVKRHDREVSAELGGSIEVAEQLFVRLCVEEAVQKNGLERVRAMAPRWQLARQLGPDVAGQLAGQLNGSDTEAFILEALADDNILFDPNLSLAGAMHAATMKLKSLDPADVPEGLMDKAMQKWMAQALSELGTLPGVGLNHAQNLAKSFHAASLLREDGVKWLYDAFVSGGLYGVALLDLLVAKELCGTDVLTSTVTYADAIHAAIVSAVKRPKYSERLDVAMAREYWKDFLWEEAKRMGQWGQYPRTVDIMLRRFSQAQDFQVKVDEVAEAFKSESLITFVCELGQVLPRGGAKQAVICKKNSELSQELDEGHAAAFLVEAKQVLQKRLRGQDAVQTFCVLCRYPEARTEICRDMETDELVNSACEGIRDLAGSELITIVNSELAPEALRARAKERLTGMVEDVRTCLEIIDEHLYSQGEVEGTDEDSDTEMLLEIATNTTLGDARDNWTLVMSSRYPGMQNTRGALLEDGNASGAGTNYNAGTNYEGRQYIQADFPEVVKIGKVAVGPVERGSGHISNKLIEGSDDGETWKQVGNTGNVPAAGIKVVNLNKPIAFKHWRISNAGYGYLATCTLRFYEPLQAGDNQKQMIASAAVRVALRDPAAVGFTKLSMLVAEARNAGVHEEELQEITNTTEELLRVLQQPMDEWSLSMSSMYAGMQNNQAVLLDEFDDNTGVGTSCGGEKLECITASFLKPTLVRMIAVAAYNLADWDNTYIRNVRIEGSFDKQMWASVGNTKHVPSKGPKYIWLKELHAFRHWRLLANSNYEQLGTAAFRLYGPGWMCTDEDVRCTLRGMFRTVLAESDPLALKSWIDEAKLVGLDEDLIGKATQAIDDMKTLVKNPQDNWTLSMSSKYNDCQNCQSVLLLETDNSTGAGTIIGTGEYIMASFSEPTTVRMITVAPLNEGGWDASYLCNKAIQASDDATFWYEVGNTGTVPSTNNKRILFPEPLSFTHWRLYDPNVGQFATAAFRFHGRRPLDEDLQSTERFILQQKLDKCKSLIGRRNDLDALRKVINVISLLDEAEIKAAKQIADEEEEALREVAVEVRSMMTDELLCSISISAKTSVAEAKAQVEEKTGIDRQKHALVVAGKKVYGRSRPLDPKRLAGDAILLVKLK